MVDRYDRWLHDCNDKDPTNMPSDKSNSNVLLPYVFIFAPFAANKVNWHGDWPFSLDVGGMTEMLEPVTIRKFLLEDFSLIHKRHISGPESSVAVFDWP